MKGIDMEMNLLRDAYRLMPNPSGKYHPETERDLAEFESRFEAIPSAYRALLKEFGGCHFVDPWIFTLEELQVEYLAFVDNYSKEEGELSSETLFPLGGLGDGSIVCIVKKSGEIAILPHDVYVDSVRDLEIIAHSLKDLILDLAEQGIALHRIVFGGEDA